MAAWLSDEDMLSFLSLGKQLIVTAPCLWFSMLPLSSVIVTIEHNSVQCNFFWSAGYNASHLNSPAAGLITDVKPAILKTFTTL